MNLLLLLFCLNKSDTVRAQLRCQSDIQLIFCMSQPLTVLLLQAIHLLDEDSQSTIPSSQQSDTELESVPGIDFDETSSTPPLPDFTPSNLE